MIYPLIIGMLFVFIGLIVFNSAEDNTTNVLLGVCLIVLGVLVFGAEVFL